MKNFFKQSLLLRWLFIALLCRMVFVVVLDADRYYLSDTRHYDAAAQQIIQGQGFGEQYYRAPFYPLVMAGVYALAGHSFLAMRIFEAALGVLLCYLVYRIAGRAFDERVAAVALGFSALYPHFILITGILYPTHVFTTLLALSVWFLLKNRSTMNMIISGCCAALAALTIPAFFFMLPFWLLWMLWSGGTKMPRRFFRTALFMLAFVAVLLPWMLRNLQTYGRLTLVQPIPHTILPDFDKPAQHQDEISHGFPSTTEYLQQHPTGTDKDSPFQLMLHYIKNPLGTFTYLVKELGHFWSPYPDRLDTNRPDYRHNIHDEDRRMFTGGSWFWRLVPAASMAVMIPVFVLAVAGLLTTRLNRMHILMLASIVALSVGYSLLFAEVRYRIPIEPYMLMFSAAGWVWIRCRLSAQTKAGI